MFTGIIEELGEIKGVKRSSRSCQLTIKAKEVLADVKLGDSIAVNGVCLTVVAYNQDFFVVDVMPETMDKTSLGDLKAGDKVNLERALRLGDRLGGHLVTGHVDGVGTIREKKDVDIAVVVEVSCPHSLLRYVIEKGSVAVDGVSLTVVEVKPGGFTVSLIPHTAKMTTLGFKKPGEKVNLEMDVIGKYLEKLMLSKDETREYENSLQFLKEHGFA